MHFRVDSDVTARVRINLCRRDDEMFGEGRTRKEISNNVHWVAIEKFDRFRWSPFRWNDSLCFPSRSRIRYLRYSIAECSARFKGRSARLDLTFNEKTRIEFKKIRTYFKCRNRSIFVRDRPLS